VSAGAEGVACASALVGAAPAAARLKSAASHEVRVSLTARMRECSSVVDTGRGGGKGATHLMPPVDGGLHLEAPYAATINWFRQNMVIYITI
jgi:hypothetical protein